MMAHVRYATQGGVSLENVHPFSRELWGIHWSFCHNGEVPKFCSNAVQEEQPLLGKTTMKDISYRPIGDTDSEAVFCAILNALKCEFGDVLPSLSVLHCFLMKVCDEIIEGHTGETIFNFLLGCGQYTQFAYSWPGRRPGSKVWNGLSYIVREPPFSTAKLVDDDYTIDFAAVNTEPTDRVAVITTKPLTLEEGWKEFKRGELLMFDKGLPYSTAESCEMVEQQGRGLYSKCFGKVCPVQRAAMCAKYMASLQFNKSHHRTHNNNNAGIICDSVEVASEASTSALSDCSLEERFGSYPAEQPSAKQNSLIEEEVPVEATVAVQQQCRKVQEQQQQQKAPAGTSPIAVSVVEC